MRPTSTPTAPHSLCRTLLCSVLLLASTSDAFSNFRATKRPAAFVLRVFHDHETDYTTQMIGSMKYSMVPMPDAMMDTTLFVGNLCEFVHDGDLSSLFQTFSGEQSLAACVARKPNNQSLQYGFVSFPTESEKEAAIVEFDGILWKGKQIKVQPILDDPRHGRVKVPERMVSFVCGEVKKTRNGQLNEMRRVARLEGDVSNARLARKKARKQKRKDMLANKLGEKDMEELARAERKGFLTLIRRSEALKKTHYAWCVDRQKPQIILYKGQGGRDKVLIDYSTVNAINLTQKTLAEASTKVINQLARYRADSSSEAGKQGLFVCDEHNECSLADFDEDITDSHLPFTESLFQGDRPAAKALCKALSNRWEIPDREKPREDICTETVSGGGRKKRRLFNKPSGMSRRKSQRQSWYKY